MEGEVFKEGEEYEDEIRGRREKEEGLEREFEILKGFRDGQ